MRPGRVVVGLGLVAVGTLFLLDRSDVLDGADVLRMWWPVAIVALGLWQLAYDRRAVLGAVAIVAVGLVLLSFTTGTVESDVLRFAWPVAIVVLGLWILAGRPSPRRRQAAAGEIDGFVAFGSRTDVVDGVAFRGGAATVLAGQLVLDLTSAEPAPGGADLAVTVVLGGIDIVVPDGWVVRISGLPLLGGWDDTTRPQRVAEPAVVRVKALVVLGGIEVKYADRWQ